MKRVKSKVKSLKGISWIPIIILGVILLFYALSMIVVLGWGLMTSLKDPWEFEKPIYNVLGFPTMEWSKEALLQLKNYKIVFDNFDFEVRDVYYAYGREIVNKNRVNFFGLIGNSALYVLGCALAQTTTTCVTSYICSKYKYKFSGVLNTLVIVIMVIPLVGTQPATVSLLRSLGLYDNMVGMWIMHCTFQGMYFLVFCGFFKGMSDTYIEAAEIDGASQFRVLFSIILPLVSKMYWTVFLLYAVGYWNDYSSVLLYMPTKPTLAYGVYVMAQGAASKTDKALSHVPVRIAACMILAIPVLILFVVCKDKLMGNVSLGGIKE